MSIAELPASARIRYVLDVLRRERGMRERVLKGDNRRARVAEIDTCIEYMTHIDEALKKARALVEQVKGESL